MGSSEPLRSDAPHRPVRCLREHLPHRPALRLLERPAALRPAPPGSAAPAAPSWPARVQRWFDRLMAS